MKTRILYLLFALCSISLHSFAQPLSEKEKHLYTSIDFGTSKADYYKKFPRKKAQVGNFTYTLFPQFYKDSVITSLLMTTDTVAVEDFDQVEKSMYNLAEVFTKELGKPGLYNKTIGAKKVLKGRFVLLTFWNIGHKYVVITLYRTVADKYYATAKIENKDYEAALIAAATAEE